VEILEKLAILAGAARYDASCATSGSERPGGVTGARACMHAPASDRPALKLAPLAGRGSWAGTRFGNTVAPGICHSFADDGRCIALLKVLYTNSCMNDCAYCVNRRSSDSPRAAFTVEELVHLTESFYRRNYIEGLFLSSAVVKSPDFTMELLIRVVRTLRLDAGFNGYVHLKVIPGASPALVREAGFWADRISANIELPSESSLRLLAPEKSGHAILSSMAAIRRDIDVNRSESRIGWLPTAHAPASDHPALKLAPLAGRRPWAVARASMHAPASDHPWPWRCSPTLQDSAFAPAGQSTQLIVGASPESDLGILGLTEALYRRYRLKRVYYSAFIPVCRDPRLPVLAAPPLRREHRLYQADWLLRFYGFTTSEILSEESPFLDLDLDPKCAWALRNMCSFPVEVNEAEYEALLRIPGLGQKSAEKIVEARRHGALSFETLKKMGVVLKRARYFVTCAGKALESRDLTQASLRRLLVQEDPRGRFEHGQLPLFEGTPV
jgi:putative DNA modification/repair radical SAM protein